MNYTLIHSNLHALHAITTSKTTTLLTSSHLHDGGFIVEIHGFPRFIVNFAFPAIIELGVCMERAALGSHGNDVAEIKTVKCSMCRKVKTRDHFINPNSDTLFHVCDYCRYLRKTKYKSKVEEWV